MRSILIIRHAQSANNALPESQRVPDPGLTEAGHRQADHLARFLATMPLTHLYCSGFRRSLDTTRAIASRMGLLPHVRQDLFEQGGCYAGFPPNPLKPQPGMGSCEIAERYPGWTIDPRINPEGWWLEEEYETQERARLRAIQVRDWIQLSIQPQDFAAMVVHADFKLLLLEAMLDTTQILEWLEPFFNTSVTQLTWQPDRWRVDMWNSVAHLPSELITH